MMLTDLKRDSLGRRLYHTLFGANDQSWTTLPEQDKHRYMSAAEQIYWMGRSEQR